MGTMGPPVRSGTLYVGNLPIDATRTEVEQICGEVGPIKKCFVLQGKNGQTAYAFVTYALPEDTDTAADELQGSSLRGSPLSISISTRKLKTKERDRKPADDGVTETENKKETSTQPKQSPFVKVKARGENNEETIHEVKKGKRVRQETEEKPTKKQKTGDGEIVVERNPNRAPNKKGRLIVRNVSFKATEASLKKHLASVGPITEVKLLRKPNGLLVGCGFVQFKHEKHAQLAIAQFNTKPFLGRPIVVDWAVEKSRYEAANMEQTPQQNSHKKFDQDDEDNGEQSSRIQANPSAEDEALDEDEDADSKEEEADGEEEDESDSEQEESDVEGDEDEEESEEEDDEDESNEGSDEDVERESENESEQAKSKQQRKQNDVEEGATLFIKNLSFDTDKEALRQLFSEYGKLKYAVLCMDPLTEHPRGTAFVQFVSAADAHKALQAASDAAEAERFTLDERRIEVVLAVSRDEIERRNRLLKDKALDGKDKRNLYLAREGLVREGSRAAEGVSRADLNKRTGLEKWKMKMLKNLNMFVSKTRLCIHNIPPEMEDSKLRDLFKKHVPDGVITEARIMRDRRDISKHPSGQSKEYGFVTFKEHEHSLAALRSINNNPELFKPTRRPIVEFAVENRTALDARRKREEKSRQMNASKPAPANGAPGGARRRRGKSTHNTQPAAAATAKPQQAEKRQWKEGGRQQGGRPEKQRRGAEARARLAAGPGPKRPAHAGMAADPTNKVLPRLKQRAGQQEQAKAITRKMLKQGKKNRPRERAGQKTDVVHDLPAISEKKSSRREKKKEARARAGAGRDDTQFSSLVDKYRQKLAAAPTLGSRWFQ